MNKAVDVVIDRAAHFFKMEAAGGIILMIAAVAALVVANTGLYPFYDYVLNEVTFRIGFAHTGSFDLQLEKSMLHWINDGLMVIFFFLIGLEIKREFVAGGLSSREKALLPVLAAAGGMAVPALIYYFINRADPVFAQGWAIPAATDIAFALGVLSLLGNRVPISLKVLLTAIAVIDDLGAIAIIALFFSHDVHMVPLYFAGMALIGLAALNRFNVRIGAPYIMLTMILWIAVLESGVHATLAGVVAALFVPIRKKDDRSLGEEMEHDLHHWVAFGVLPIFAFANAGVPLGGITWADLLHPVTTGIAAGLVFGKQVGVFVMLWLAVVLGLSPRPEGTNWRQLYAVSLLCGIGFTMSLFIGGLAFDDPGMQASVRIGVLSGSIVSALAGYALLRLGTAARDPAA